MNAIPWPIRRRPEAKYTPSTITPKDKEASQKAVRGYSFSRIRSAERLATLGLQFGAFGMMFGLIWMGIWLGYPREVVKDHWLIWDGSHSMPYEIPDLSIALKDAPNGLNRYFSEQYVLHRERFYYDLFSEDRKYVGWQTGKDEMAEYSALNDPKNPDAPAVDPGKNGFIEVDITGSDVTYDKEHDRYTSKVYFTRRVQKYGYPRLPPVLMAAEWTWEKHPENVPNIPGANNPRKYSPVGMVVLHYNRRKEGVNP